MSERNQRVIGCKRVCLHFSFLYPTFFFLCFFFFRERERETKNSFDRDPDSHFRIYAVSFGGGGGDILLACEEFEV